MCPVAILVSASILLIGFLSIFIHGPYMKKLYSSVAGYEGRYESAPQLLTQFVFILQGSRSFDRGSDNTTWEKVYAIVSSLMMLSKDLSEDILMSPEFQRLPILEKLTRMKRLFPAIIFTAVFRLGSLALFVHHIGVLDIGLLIIPFKIIFVVIPSLTLFYTSKRCFESNQLTFTECSLGVVAELSTFYSWNCIRSPKIRGTTQLLMLIYFTLLNSIYSIWSAFTPLTSKSDNGEDDAFLFDRQSWAITVLCCGWTSIALYFKNIFIIYVDDDYSYRQDENNEGSPNVTIQRSM